LQAYILWKAGWAFRETKKGEKAAAAPNLCEWKKKKKALHKEESTEWHGGKSFSL